jgi:CRP-like cAMP-binding protein
LVECHFLRQSSDSLDFFMRRFFLNSGVIEIYSKEGFKKVVRKPGDFFGEGALISPNGLRTASIRCLTPVHVIEVGREYFEKFLDADYDLKLHLREMNTMRQREKANAMLEVQQCLKHLVVHKNDFIFTDDNPGGDLYLLDEGHVDILLNDRKVFSVRNHGDIFGEHSLVYGRPRNLAAQCKSGKCKLHVLTSKDFDTIVNSHPSMKLSLRNLFNRREFQKAVCIMTNKAFPENEDDLRRAFDTVDKNHSGKLELANIRNAIKQLDPAYTEDEIVAILTSLDLDESGEVSWPEFKRIFGIGNENV